MNTFEEQAFCGGVGKLQQHKLGNIGLSFVKLLDFLGLQRIKIAFIHRYGKLINETEWQHNIFTSAGKAQMALLAGDATAVPFTYLAVGTGATTPAIGDTTLTAEITDTGLARASATVSRVTTTVTNDTLQLLYAWTASGVKAVAEIGAFNAASSGTLLSHLLTGTLTTTNGTILTATFKFKFA